MISNNNQGHNNNINNNNNNIKNNNINTNLTVAFRSLGKTFFDHKYLKWDQYNKQSHNNDINKNNNKTGTITTTTTVASGSVC